jgi:hypothetical protein
VGVLLSVNRLIRISGNVQVGALNYRVGRRIHNHCDRSGGRPVGPLLDYGLLSVTGFTWSTRPALRP